MQYLSHAFSDTVVFLILDFDDAQVADFDEWLSSTLSECDETTASSLGSCSPTNFYPCNASIDSGISFDMIPSARTTRKRKAVRAAETRSHHRGTAKRSKQRSLTTTLQAGQNNKEFSNQLRSISADDVRRSFSVAFADLMDLGDPRELHTFLSAHACDEVQFTAKGKVSVAASTYVVAHGRSSVLTYFDAFFAAVPDFIFELETTTIEPSDNDETIITSTFTLSGKQVLEMITDHQYTLLTTPANLNLDLTNHRTIAFAINPDSGKIDTTLPPCDRLLLEVKSKAKDLALQGKLTFHVNADKKIDSFQWMFLPQQK